LVNLHALRRGALGSAKSNSSFKTPTGVKRMVRQVLSRRKPVKNNVVLRVTGEFVTNTGQDKRCARRRFKGFSLT